MAAETPRSAVRAWRDGLVNLDARNRLLNFRPSAAGTLEIAGPAAPDIVSALRGDRDYGFLPAGAKPEPGGLFRTSMPAVALGAQLRRLLRKSRQDFLDRGVAALHLAIGLLHWRDEEDAAFTSPILLVPAELTALGPGDVPRLRVRGEDPIVNPALVLRLRQLGITVPGVDGLAGLDVRAYLEDLRSTVSNREWTADESVLLSRFTFHKEAMYRDLLDNESRIASHPLVEALAGKVGTAAPCGQVDLPDSEQVAFQLPPGGWKGGGSNYEPYTAEAPEDLPLVLDADATQRACIDAALRGDSFVLDGPPGTGKSQTIANLIACLLHAGRRVLFVSEKAAALEVVRNRLAGASLDPYLLELHSHKATRKEVARTLAAALDRPAPAPADRPGHDRLRELRTGLDGYATAMNERREPLGRTLHEVLAECARLPDLGAPSPYPGVLTAQTMREVGDAADALSRCRRAAAQPETFPWRDVTERAPLEEALRRVQLALRALEDETEPHRRTSDAFGLTRPSGAGNLALLVTHAARRPASVADEWLTAPILDPYARVAERRSRQLAAARRAGAAVREAAGVAWHELPDVEVPDLGVAHTALTADEEARHLSAEADDLDALREVSGSVTFADLGRFGALAELAGRVHRPEPYWFGPGILTAVAAAADELRRCHQAVAGAEAEARRWFSPSIVDQPVERLAERLTHEHRGLRKLLGAYRRDWDAVAAYALLAVPAGDAVAHVGAAVAWQRARRERAAAEQRYAPLLGRYWQGGPALDEALRHAGELVRLSPTESLPIVADQICRPEPAPHLTRWAGRARALAALHPATRRLHEVAASDRAAAAVRFAAATALRAYGKEIDLHEARRLSRLRREAADAEAAIEPGPDEPDEAIAWTRAARKLVAGVDRPLTAGQAEVLRSEGGAAGLAERFGAWEDARDVVVAAFAPGRRDEIGAALDDYDGDLVAALLDDPEGQAEWLDYDRVRRVLTPAAIDFGVENGEQIRAALERALLTTWAEGVIRDDERLHPYGGIDRDRLVEEFRRLDAALAGQAPATVVEALEQRRTEARVPAEATLLRREGMKETRHLSVRDLLGRTRQTVQAATPCFLMSPLAVSQFLPPDLTFDVVIFDEASQLAPADAINCLYRADAMIVAGDERQLPPTSFFTRTETDSDTDVNDFQSILELAKGCGAFAGHGLGWHYRSRHEALIAFANNRFYGGRLRTFPGANADPETGVELIGVHGTYRRGGSRDNPVEAEKAAERIVACLTTRPELSLGVVTFSVAQAEAIEAALERATAVHPGLERLLAGDRLSGFFIKSLESVQGDERDVMIFSVGYGRDEQGRISTHFGALNQPDGWRRLNVAITRARRRVEIISSIRARDLDSANEGVRHLAAYLDYAERGAAALPGPVPATDPLVESVLETVRSWGYRVKPGVGLDGYRIDVGVRHLTPGGGYVLGIECDGPRYGAIGSARDRDRLCAEVLTGLGWRLHRVWSAAWHHDRAGEEARLRAAIEQATGGLPAARPYRRADLLGLRLVSATDV
ncbi:DUF4011 domain-containing protein [Actinoplanes bogorensis]|uniref:DUF4011 domain-containing protein n=1 Tax=Paractinoplanes bogorensis TaxID=1610840 RepID=A0ABS5YLH2_9ACTN|nr:DUF4011 domain-containing protein [Actinoplanes bogorensis]MBU2664319.1 DUF4011 domain-containing protein [Actinoplanes bogorensis]